MALKEGKPTCHQLSMARLTTSAVEGTWEPGSVSYVPSSSRDTVAVGSREAFLRSFVRLQFGYSFLLHLYSSPLTHHHPPPAASQGRPDVHAVFQLWLSLAEVRHPVMKTLLT